MRERDEERKRERERRGEKDSVKTRTGGGRNVTGKCDFGFVDVPSSSDACVIRWL